MLKIGDKFIRISKYGYMIGIVESIMESESVNLHLGAIISEIKVKSTKGIYYDYNECQKVIKELSQEEIDMKLNLLNKLNQLKK